MNQARYEVHQGADGQWYWRLRAPNARIVAQGEGYKTRAGACRGVDGHRRHARTLAVITLQPPA